MIALAKQSIEREPTIAAGRLQRKSVIADKHVMVAIHPGRPSYQGTENALHSKYHVMAQYRPKPNNSSATRMSTISFFIWRKGLTTPSSATPGRGRGCEHGGARRRRGLCRASWRAAQPVTEPVG